MSPRDTHHVVVLAWMKPALRRCAQRLRERLHTVGPRPTRHLIASELALGRTQLHLEEDSGGERDRLLVKNVSEARLDQHRFAVGKVEGGRFLVEPELEKSEVGIAIVEHAPGKREAEHGDAVKNGRRDVERAGEGDLSRHARTKKEIDATLEFATNGEVSRCDASGDAGAALDSDCRWPSRARVRNRRRRREAIFFGGAVAPIGHPQGLDEHVRRAGLAIANRQVSRRLAGLGLKRDALLWAAQARADRLIGEAVRVDDKEAGDVGADGARRNLLVRPRVDAAIAQARDREFIGARWPQRGAPGVGVASTNVRARMLPALSMVGASGAVVCSRPQGRGGSA